MDVRCERVTAVLPDENAFAVAYAALPDWRRRKCDAHRFAAGRFRSVAVWELLRRMLAERGVRAETLAVAENEFGKPAFDPSLGLHFSLSHAGDRVMAAVHDRPVGCDVERIRSLDEAVVREALTVAEFRWLGRFPFGAERDRAFARLWVRKESYVKAVGRGFEIEPKSFAVLPDDSPSGWAFRDMDFDDGHLGCVAILI